MAQVFSGFLCGYGIALLSTPWLAVMLIRLRVSSAFLGRLLPEGTSAVSLAVILHGALFLFWSAAGMVLGLGLIAMRGAKGALGSANAPFSLLVAGLTIALLAPVAILFPPARRTVAAYALIVLLVFGWLMPYMAQWSKL